MHDPHDELQLPFPQQQTTTTPATSAARYGVGPSKGRSNARLSTPGVAEGLGHQGAPEEEQPADTSAEPLPRASDAAAVHRVARRRKHEKVQRTERVDVRYSVDEKGEILAEARALNIAAAHYVGAIVMAHIHGELGLPGQRTPLDDYIDELNALRQQVAKIGHNVNQIAKKFNSGGDPHPGDTAGLAQAERTLTAAATAVRHIAAAANEAVAQRAA
ncbi:plasmid mobilization relaxosome protein MobC [Streptomyces chrestomyceticus]|uniref:plasmid mobilization relaxosome protein MobC n=1 Tax=Streptomyces chrestomyceticus TaxID=68185 RepID=UPI0035A91177